MKKAIKKTNEPVVDYSLTQIDFKNLEDEFFFSKEEIEKLYTHMTNMGQPSYYAAMQETLKMLGSKTIDQYIEESNQLKDDCKEYAIEAAKPIEPTSITIFEKIQPSTIVEIKQLREEALQVVAENPVITVIDNDTYIEAKKVASILLSASTKIDGTKGVFANGKRLINDFKSKFDAIGKDIAYITRTPYSEQKKTIDEWENRLTAEKNRRIKLLFEVPFVFNGEFYHIGSLIITESNIIDLTNEDFEKVLVDGKAIKEQEYALKSQQDAKIAEQDKQIAELKAMLEKLQPKPVETTEVVAEVVKPIVVPCAKNKLLEKLDADNISEVGTELYNICRDFYIQALQDAAVELQLILDDQYGKQKSVEIKKLIDVWKQVKN